MSFIKEIDFTWSLFLDRDGVINKRIPDDYVKSFKEFEFTENTLNAIQIFNKYFSTIVVVTNQQGIGKGLMTANQLDEIHNEMILKVSESKGHIDKVYFCPDLKNAGSFYRKPAVGMGLKAKKDFKKINFKKAVMIGDSVSDMKFGRSLGMKTVFIAETNEKAILYPELIDFVSPSLYHFSQILKSSKTYV